MPIARFRPMARQVLRRRGVLISDELWARVEKAAETQSAERGCDVSTNDWIVDAVESNLFLFIELDDIGENPS